jgi:hypothetical protein
VNPPLLAAKEGKADDTWMKRIKSARSASGYRDAARRPPSHRCPGTLRDSCSLRKSARRKFILYVDFKCATAKCQTVSGKSKGVPTVAAAFRSAGRETLRRTETSRSTRSRPAQLASMSDRYPARDTSASKLIEACPVRRWISRRFETHKRAACSRLHLRIYLSAYSQYRSGAR